MQNLWGWNQSKPESSLALPHKGVRMNANERFEIVADLFYRDTGFIRPGKSLPMEMCSTESEQQRQVAWEQWTMDNRLVPCALQRIADLEEKLKQVEQDF